MLEFHVGNLYTRVDKKKAARNELTELHKILSVKVPGHYFSPHFRRGLWDGYKRFFNLLTYTLYTGLLTYSTSRLTCPYTIVDDRTEIPHQNNPLSLKGVELRDYQIKIVNESVEKKRGIISAPPNSGKTECAAGIIKVLGLPANFLTHRLTLLNQTKKRFETRLGIEVGIIGGGEEEIKDVNVISVQSLSRKLTDPHIKELLGNTPVVIVDECHHASSKTFEKCLKACEGAYYRFGLSATALMRDEISNFMVMGLTGDEIAGVTSEELIKTGISATPSVYLMKVTEPKIKDVYTFDKVYEEGIVYNQYRNSLVVSSAKKFLDQGKSVFILVWRIVHGALLQQMLEDVGVEVEFISGEENSDTIDNVMERFGKELKCVISSTISDEGLDVPSIDVLIIATGFKSPLKTVQRVGRGSRKKKVGPNVVIIVDFVDFQSKKYLYKHSMDRCREYLNMGGTKIFEVMDNEWKNVEER